MNDRYFFSIVGYNYVIHSRRKDVLCDKCTSEEDLFPKVGSTIVQMKTNVRGTTNIRRTLLSVIFK
jgi:hypothetical protein